MITKPYTESQIKQRLSTEEKRRADVTVFLMLTAVGLMLSIIFSL